jgi:hypothetical protein
MVCMYVYFYLNAFVSEVTFVTDTYFVWTLLVLQVGSKLTT